MIDHNLHCKHYRMPEYGEKCVWLSDSICRCEEKSNEWEFDEARFYCRLTFLELSPESHHLTCACSKCRPVFKNNTDDSISVKEKL